MTVGAPTTEVQSVVPLVHLSGGKRKFIRLVGLAGIIGGLLLVLVGGTVWGVVSSQLSAEQITVAEDSPFLANAPVADPFTALAEAAIINTHALEGSGGLTYAQMDREDPARATLASASFLRASLFTSVVAFGVSAFAIALGLMIGFFGWSIREIVPAHKHQA
ncbi:MAG: aromatic ring-opening dioxygenase LigA [Microbacteriaceae bacterium]